MAKEMPLIMSNTKELHYVLGSELITQGETHLPDGSKIDPDKKYQQWMPVQIAFNHENRLKSAYKRNGREGVSHYIQNIRRIVKAS